jgi:hypothetical protein
MDYFLNFAYEILKLQIFFLNLSGLTWVNPYNPGPGFLARSTPDQV